MTTKEFENHGGPELLKEMSDALGHVKDFEQKLDAKYNELHERFDGLKKTDAEIAAKVEKATEEYRDIAVQLQASKEAYNLLKQQLDAPIYRSESELADHDRKAAVDFQRQWHEFKGRAPEEFREDTDNLVDVKAYRSAAQKMVALTGQYDYENRDRLRRVFSEAEQKAFDNASLSSGFISPQLLGLEIDCNIECGSTLDLYGQINVTKSNFMYPKIESYGDIGQYGCDALCDAELGPEGNIRFLNGRVFDFRGLFCFQKKVLQESNIDLLSFMIRSAQRSHRINRNQALITGDGVNTPMGWLTASETTDTGFPNRLTRTAGKFDHRDFRMFLASYPVEYGRPTAVMHQNAFAYLAAQVDGDTRFIFGDGDLAFSPDRVRDTIRISNCLPDPTNGLTLGGEGQSDLPANAFIAALADWKTAYYAVSKRPMFFEQYVGGSTAWCVKYQFGAEDGGFLGCGAAGQILRVQ